MIRIKIFGTDEHEVENIAKVLINHATENKIGIAVGKAYKRLGGFEKQVVINDFVLNIIRNGRQKT